MIFGSLTLAFVGILLTLFGILPWKKEKVSLFHEHHVSALRPENKKAFCTLCGIAILLMGAGLLLSAILLPIFQSLVSFLPLALGLLLGLYLFLGERRS